MSSSPGPFPSYEASSLHVVHGTIERRTRYDLAQLIERSHPIVLSQVDSDRLCVFRTFSRTPLRSCLDSHLREDLTDAALVPLMTFCWIDAFCRELLTYLAHTQSSLIQLHESFFRLYRQPRIPSSWFSAVEAMRFEMTLATQGDSASTASMARHYMMILRCGCVTLEAGSFSFHTYYQPEGTVTNLSFAQHGHGNAYA